MRFERSLSISNLRRKPVRTAALVLLTAFLSFAVFGGSLLVCGLRNGLSSYRSRLGADIVVIPNSARSKGTLDSILLQGIPGYFYMDSSVLDKVREIEGVEAAAPQFYLASASAGCCSVAVQIIGFDPDSDFSIQPWIRENYSGDISDGDIIVGSNITVPANRILSFYNTDCHIAAQLASTGSGLDNAVYANMNTIRQMMSNAKELGFDYFDSVPENKAISSVMIKVMDGYDIDSVTNDINIHIRRVEATRSQNMISGIANGLSKVSSVIGVLIAFIWILAVGILMIAANMIFNERVKEFAILRVVGISQKKLCSLVSQESLIISLAGAAAGIGAAALAVFPFGTAIRHSLDLPYLMPDAVTVTVLMCAAVLLAVVSGQMTSRISISKITSQETGILLRDGA